MVATAALQKFRVFDNDGAEPDKLVNRWIVSATDFVEHQSPEHAEDERQRLTYLYPERQFRIYRIKSVTVPTDAVVIVDQKEPGDGW